MPPVHGGHWLNSDVTITHGAFAGKQGKVTRKHRKHNRYIVQFEDENLHLVEVELAPDHMQVLTLPAGGETLPRHHRRSRTTLTGSVPEVSQTNFGWSFVKDPAVRLKFHDRTIELKQKPEVEDVAFLVWEGAIVLSHYLEEHESISGKRCIELGSGTGLMGICVSFLGADVTITDLEHVVPLMQDNVNSNCTQTCKIRAMAHSWGSSVADLDPPYDVILCSDVIYNEKVIPQLVASITALSNESTDVFLAYRQRYGVVEHEFFERMDVEFTTQQLPLPSKWDTKEVQLYRFRKRIAGASDSDGESLSVSVSNTDESAEFAGAAPAPQGALIVSLVHPDSAASAPASATSGTPTASSLDREAVPPTAHDAALARLQQLEALVNKLQDQHMGDIEQVALLESQLDSERSASKELTARITTLQQELSEARSIHANTLQECETLRTQVTGLQHIVRQRKHNAERMSMSPPLGRRVSFQTPELQLQLDALQERFTELEETTAARIEELEAALQLRDDEKAEHVTRMNELRMAHAVLQTQHDGLSPVASPSLVASVASPQDQHQQQEQRVDMQNQIDAQQSEISRLQKQLLALRVKEQPQPAALSADDFSSPLSYLTQFVDCLGGDTATFQAGVASLKSLLCGAGADVDRLQRECKQANEQLSRAHADAALLQDLSVTTSKFMMSDLARVRETLRQERAQHTMQVEQLRAYQHQLEQHLLMERRVQGAR
eukprot:TRINITY_DN919_c0_g1_i2.p1 TRINITY_DN919_c0_g1~~TRINITY_DN919_c0_g1_i2.p1  ORF type:complete len:724 (-),score=160.69 TRINITY_DN919_c0_g1_i2:29-2200(-)